MKYRSVTRHCRAVQFVCLLVGLPIVGACTSTVAGTAVPIGVTEAAGAGEVLVFDTSVLEEGVRQVLTEGYYVTGVEDVRCPPDEEVRVGRRFGCEVVIDGSRRSVIITVRSNEGEYEVSPPE